MLMNYYNLIKYYEDYGCDALISLLEKNKFKLVSWGTFTDVYRFKNDPFVIKICKRGDNTLPRLYDKRVKKLNSLFIGYKYLSFDSKVGVQDFVLDYYSVKKPTQKILRDFVKAIKNSNDIHVGNVGVLNEKIVVFDF